MSISLDFVTDTDVEFSNQFDFIGVEENLFVYKNNINNNLAYFSHKLVDLNNVDNYTIYY
ncbi:unknown [Choristoneura occidentalis granulovirus]|uniref:Uncharacterized protein n=1 Tax=Choristoneura occidentalis granulovirus TaxID=364745 RepID=Q1A4I5_9BBAC|nr:unknown [Choristoneura fumiferana granulovirus]ABC61245.1 unknown [Choristoneura fumiferana granulovirus]